MELGLGLKPDPGLELGWYARLMMTGRRGKPSGPGGRWREANGGTGCVPGEDHGRLHRGLQSRVSPVLNYVKELIATGYVGEVLSCHAVCMRDGPLERASSRAWQRDASLGANTLTIANGHVIDALRFVAGNFTQVACMLTTQARQWYETDTKQWVDVTSPDNVLVSGKLASGAVPAGKYVVRMTFSGR